MWETIAILASTMVRPRTWIKIGRNWGFGGTQCWSETFWHNWKANTIAILCCGITNTFNFIIMHSDTPPIIIICCFLNANMQSDIGTQHIREKNVRCANNECKWFFRAPREKCSFQFSVFRYRAYYVHCTYAYIKLNMPILRANYVKVSRLLELAMFRNVYNQNENLYNPRALTYIV